MDSHNRAMSRSRRRPPVLGGREPYNTDEANLILSDIRAARGVLDDDILRDLDHIPELSRDFILSMAENSQDAAGELTITATEFYSSTVRVLYELIQNADDAKHEFARSEGLEPALSLKITNDKLIVESNEDGFCRANVEAICATRRSSKVAKTDDSSIGEKGLGFKSVFIIAHEVEIHSRLASSCEDEARSDETWAFQFKHIEGDNGVGMITPITVTPTDPLDDDIGTRITLSLMTSSDAHSKLVDEMESLPTSTLMFLNKLRELSINVSDKRRTVIKKEPLHTYIDPNEKWSYWTLTRELQPDNASQSLTQLLAVYQMEVDNMPPEPKRPLIKKTVIKLAFPCKTDEQGLLKPSIDEEGEHVSAFLPISRERALKFLIHANFVTAAGRESIKPSCAWNGRLHDEVAEAFCQAVSTFCARNDDFQFTWMHYLPREKLTGSFWNSFSDLIYKKLAPLAVFWSRDKLNARVANTLRVLPNVFRNKDEPLFDDPVDSAFLAAEYLRTANFALTKLGGKVLSWDEIMEMIKEDLTHNSASKIYSTPADDPWQHSFSSLLLDAFDIKEMTHFHSRLKHLTIIPCAGDRWLSGNQRVFFPTSENISIPDDIGLNLVRDDAMSTDSRSRLFAKLGVTSCDAGGVCNKILRPGPIYKWTTNLKMIDRLQYLFHFWEEPGILISKLDIPLDDDNFSTSVHSALGPVYFHDEGKSSTDQLLKEEVARQNVLFLSTALETAVGPEVRSHGRSWKEWLQIITGARYHPILNNPRHPESLSSTMEAVIQHNSPCYLETLRVHWSEYQRVINVNPALRAVLSRSKVPSESNDRVALCSTYLPLPELKAGVHEFNMMAKVPFPLLPVTLSAANQRDWRFLEDLGVRATADLEFYIDILKGVTQSDPPLAVEQICLLYAKVYASTTPGLLPKLQAQFADQFLVYSPSICDDSPWVTSNICVWEGPSVLRTLRVLKSDYENDLDVIKFFTVGLGIKNATASNILRELEDIKDRGLDTSQSRSFTEVVMQLYEYLDGTQFEKGDWKEIQHEFVTHELIWIDNTWHSPKNCVWECPFEPVDTKVIGNTYRNLHRFFVSTVGVKTATLAMKIRQISKIAVQIGRGEAQRYKGLKEVILTVGLELARNEGTRADVEHEIEDLLKTGINFLPGLSREGEETLFDTSEEFFIDDHERYSKVLRGHWPQLDFTPGESKTLFTFFEKLGIENRYLSTCVLEKSSVEQEPVTDQHMTALFRRKAYAMFCCAAKYRSMKALRGEMLVYDTLRRMHVCKSDDIKTYVVYQQDETTEELPPVQSGRIRMLHQFGVIAHEGSDVHEAEDEGLSEEEDDHDPVQRPNHTGGSSRQSAEKKDDGDEEKNVLQLIIPEDGVTRKTCFRTQLPEVFCEILNIDDMAARHPLAELLRNDVETKQDVDHWMEDFDVLEVSWISKREHWLQYLDVSDVQGIPEPPSEINTSGTSSPAQTDDDDETEPVSATAGSPVQQQPPEDIWQRLAELTISPDGVVLVDGHLPADNILTRSRSQPLGINLTTKSISVHPSIERPTTSDGFLRTTAATTLIDSHPASNGQAAAAAEPTVENPAYGDLLKYLIAAAEEDAKRYEGVDDPAVSGVQDATQRTTSFNHVATFGRRTLNAFRHDTMIGAAGELYVFHFLRCLDLPDFTLDNWQSCIRNRVGVPLQYTNTAYARLQNIIGSGREQADIVFTAPAGLLTRTLSGYIFGELPPGFEQEEESQEMEYYFEVKTTPGRYSTPFYVSRGQYARMKEYKYAKPVAGNGHVRDDLNGNMNGKGEGNEEQRVKKKVYVIVRVYGLMAGEAGLGMMLFVDPWREVVSGRDRGNLRFTQGHWVVQTMDENADDVVANDVAGDSEDHGRSHDEVDDDAAGLDEHGDAYDDEAVADDNEDDLDNGNVDEEQIKRRSGNNDDADGDGYRNANGHDHSEDEETSDEVDGHESHHSEYDGGGSDADTDGGYLDLAGEVDVEDSFDGLALAEEDQRRDSDDAVTDPVTTPEAYY